MRNRSQRAAPLAVAILLALSATTQALDNQQSGQAESGVKELDKVVVTGSSIPRTDTETASPVQVITAAEIERSGKATVGEYLQTLTANGGGSIPKSFGNGFARHLVGAFAFGPVVDDQREAKPGGFGHIVDLAARVIGPELLALAVLAICNRTKR